MVPLLSFLGTDELHYVLSTLEPHKIVATSVTCTLFNKTAYSDALWLAFGAVQCASTPPSFPSDMWVPEVGPAKQQWLANVQRLAHHAATQAAGESAAEVAAERTTP